MATSSSTNPTGAATTLAMLAIPMNLATIPPHSAIVSTIDKARSMLYFVICSLLSPEIPVCISLIYFVIERINILSSRGVGRII